MKKVQVFAYQGGTIVEIGNTVLLLTFYSMHWLEIGK
jgi:hypothetical protein